jgi:hypothetical protein
MLYIFLVNETNFPKCLKFSLFGVPDTSKAYGQINNVCSGEKLFVYIYGVKKIRGVYKATSDPFAEEHANRGPWLGSGSRAKEKGYYPYRVHVKILRNYPNGIDIDELEKLGTGIDENKFKGKSVLYITDKQAEIIERTLEDKNPNEEPIETEIFSSSPTREKNIFEFKGGFESQLQLLVQKNIEKLERGLSVIDTYYNVSAFLGYRGEIDILARDRSKNFVVVELKKDRLPKEIWSQLFGYSHAIWSTLAKDEDVGVRSIAVCKEISRDTLFAYSELRRLLEGSDLLKLFTYLLEERKTIDFFEKKV